MLCIVCSDWYKLNSLFWFTLYGSICWNNKNIKSLKCVFYWKIVPYCFLHFCFLNKNIHQNYEIDFVLGNCFTLVKVVLLQTHNIEIIQYIKHVWGVCKRLFWLHGKFVHQYSDLQILFFTHGYKFSSAMFRKFDMKMTWHNSVLKFWFTLFASMCLNNKNVEV